MGGKRRLALAAALAAYSAAACGADLAAALATLRDVRAEGLGNKLAKDAWKDVAAAKPAELVAALTAWKGMHPVAANYLHSAIRAAADAAGEQLPVADLEAFVKDGSHAPEARRLAFELVVQAKPERREPLLEGMLDDRSRELRYDAVALLTSRAEAALKAEKKDDALKLYEQALGAAREESQVQALASAIRKLGKPLDLARHFGLVQQWMLVGPFDNKGGKGWNKAYPPEEKYDPAAEYDGQLGKVKWFAHETKDEMGSTELNDVYKERHKGCVTYAAAEFIAAEDFEGEIRLGSATAWKLWLNGAPLFERNESHAGYGLDQYTVKAKFGKGRNLILLKLCQNEQTEPWAQNYLFCLRVCDANGTAILSTRRPPGKATFGGAPEDQPADDGKNAKEPPKKDAEAKPAAKKASP